MCIGLSDAVKKKYRGRTHGWKVFPREGGELYGEYCGIFEPRPIEKWIKSDDFGESNTISYFPSYPAGWHIYLRRADARNNCTFDCVVRKVHFRKPVAYGYQGNPNSPVVVAKEILIEKRN